MTKKILLLAGLLLFTTAYLFPQTATLKTYGVDPREAAANTNDIFNRAYNGLQNVGIQTQTYLVGQLTGAMITSPTWTVVEKPAGSNAGFGADELLNDSTQAIIFTPDSVGVYKIQFSQGNASAMIIIHAAKYLGYATGPIGCNNGYCHSDKVEKWEQTGHFKIFEEGLDGTLSNHYGSSCIGCHTTGNDPNANNNGFDDFPFVFPDTLMPGMFDSLMTVYPTAMARARVQCESCHGPASDHYADTTNFKIAVTLDYEDCAWCHDSGHHVFPAQFKSSKHFLIPDGQTRASCAPCHNGAGFVEYIKNGKQPLTTNLPENVPISCAVCHDPHDVTNPHQLRTVQETLLNGFEVTNAGNGTLCMNCHHARANAVEYTNNYLNNLSTHYGPHHSPQGDMLEGTNAITFGQNIPSSPHIEEVENACVGCHMYPETTDSLGNVILMGSHSFSMTSPDGEDHVAPCQGCHGNFGSEFSDKKYYVNGNADLDGDGVANGFQIEVQGLLDTLALHLPPIGSLNVVIADSSVTLVQAQAAYNYFMIEADGSFGIHNPDFTYGLLKASLNAVNVVLAVGNEKNNMPHDFKLAQNYPNPFNPTTTISFSLAKSTHVSLAVYNITGQQVKVLIDQELNIGTHNYNFDATNLASGVYFYRIITPEFTATKKMVLLR